ncbi:urea ABC transporter, permease protein UrtB [Halomicroarcula sp. GCM10025324]|jgi:branched-chain amino acid transport system permease protein|uniref:urea ABC transporter, permease protein UrtB n=1 Tax=Haloarcula TaxID=2237 RepID=UPI0023E7B16F|nr:urea ABC transporter, permease protein UrtB [Halomicroarcula sp. ZS-22-S1]
MVNGVNLFFQFLDSFGFIVLAAIGLAVIFGMMGVINLAHGELIMIGAYGTTLVANAGAPLVLAMAAGVLAAAVAGFIIERLIVKRLYHRPLDSMVATWALGLALTQVVRIIFGNSLSSIGLPFGAIRFGAFSYSMYRTVLSVVALALLVGAYLVFTRTEFGIRARATIQDADTARAMGVDTDRMYTSTFVIGCALAGLTGALYAPALSIVPGMGSTFLVEAFVAVVTGGTSVLLGTTLAAGVLGSADALFTNLYGTFIGQVAMLIVAISILRFLPTGLSGALEGLREQLRGDN